MKNEQSHDFEAAILEVAASLESDQELFQQAEEAIAYMIFIDVAEHEQKQAA